MAGPPEHVEQAVTTSAHVHSSRNQGSSKEDVCSSTRRQDVGAAASGAGPTRGPGNKKTKSGSCMKPHGSNKETNIRLEPIAKLRLSVEAMGRSELNISARWKAGSGEVEDGMGAEGDVDAMEPADERRAMSV